MAAVRPFSLDSPQGLLINIIPGRLAAYFFTAYCTRALSTRSSTAETRNTKFGLAPLRVMGVAAAHTPIKGIFSLLTRGTMARETGESMPPNSTATPSLKISSRAAICPFDGLDSSSRRMRVSGRPPSNPPRALISSMAMVKPRVMPSPDLADCPDNAATKPTLIGSAARTDAASDTKRVDATRHQKPIVRIARALDISSPYARGFQDRCRIPRT